MGVIDSMKQKGVISIFFIAVLFGCQISGNREVPEDLLGVSETSSSRYENCSLEFDSKRVIFLDGLTHVNITGITNMKQSGEDEKT